MYFANITLCWYLEKFRTWYSSPKDPKLIGTKEVVGKWAWKSVWKWLIPKFPIIIFILKPSRKAFEEKAQIHVHWSIAIRIQTEIRRGWLVESTQTLLVWGEWIWSFDCKSLLKSFWGVVVASTLLCRFKSFCGVVVASTLTLLCKKKLPLVINGHV